MRTRIRSLISHAAFFSVTLVAAQDGDHLTTNGFGQSFLAPDALVPGGLITQPFNVSIGTAAGGFATLRVRGDQLPVVDEWQNNPLDPYYTTFRTDVGLVNQKWSMVRGQNEIGSLYHTAANTSFFIKAVQPTAHLWLRNSDDDGVKVAANSQTGTPQYLNGFLINRISYGAIGENGAVVNMNLNAPWARWHLVHETIGAANPSFGFRPWMRNGVLGTGHSDLFYMGHKYAMTGGTGAEENDNSNMVAAWGDDELPAGYSHAFDNFTFRYVGTPGAGNSAGSIEGLEIMRLRPFRRNPGDRIEGFVGIGDWVNNAQMPEQRLDVMNGLVRIRQLPTDLEMTGATKAMVVDATGVVGWRTFPTGGGTDCRWALNGSNNLITATTWTGLCVAQDKLVGIGIAGPTAKLHVVHTPSASGGYIALTSNLVASGSSADDNYSIVGGVTGSGRNVRGVQGNAFSNGSSSTQLIGVEGSAYDATGVAASTIGVNADARSGTNTQQVFGVKAFTAGGSSTSRAGFFQGHLEHTGTLFGPSDVNLKDNINDLTGALVVLNQLQPRRFDFRTVQYPQLNLPSGPQMGLIAQELMLVLPGLVGDSYVAERTDSSGVVVSAAVAYKSVDYISLIPLLIAGLQEQQSQISELQQDLSLCCNSGVNDGRSMDQGTGLGFTQMETDLRIIPNPVAANTQLRYTVGDAGRIRLEVSDGTGRLIEVLEESTRGVGSFTYEWNTQQLSAGTYYCTLFVNDEPLVKKAVKLNER